MDIKINPLMLPKTTEVEKTVRTDDEQFKFTLIKNIEDNSLAERLNAMMKILIVYIEVIMLLIDKRDLGIFSGWLLSLLSLCPKATAKSVLYPLCCRIVS